MRRVLIALPLLLAAEGLWAFDSTAWLSKRQFYAYEADRLRGLYATYAARATTPAEGVVIPLETFENGRVKSVIEAARAQYFNEQGLIWAENVTIRQFKEGGEKSSEIQAESCLIDKVTKSGWAEGPACVSHGKTSFKGKNVYFLSGDSYVKAYADCELTSTDLKFGEGRP